MSPVEGGVFHGNKRMKTAGSAIMWFRSDLRVHDNPALYNCCIKGKDTGVVAVYVISAKEWMAHDFSPCKVDLILRSVAALKTELWNDFGIPLHIEYGSFLSRRYKSFEPDVLPQKSATDRESKLTPEIMLKLCSKYGAKSLFFNEEYEFDEIARDEAVTIYLQQFGIDVHKYHDQCIARPGIILNKENKPYTVFTPFKNCLYKWLEANNSALKMAPLPNRNSVSFPSPDQEVPDEVKGFEMQDSYKATIRPSWPVGSSSVKNILDQFVDRRVSAYKDDRDGLALDRTSKLSAYLSIGVMSIRQCINRAITPKGAKEPLMKNITSGNAGIVCWVSELVWRDFYRHITFLFPRVCRGMPFKLVTTKIQWRNDPEEFKRWCEGKTGYPIVDASMRQLNESGWMHNRGRMIVAMFLTKHLLIDWRLGESYFMKHLIDGDFCSNNGGWQWSASTGTDAQPYFRIFNPTLQSEKNDPNGDYIRRWVPELASLDSKSIHNPYKVLKLYQFKKLKYPVPIVDHDKARKRALHEFKSVLSKDDK